MASSPAPPPHLLLLPNDRLERFRDVIERLVVVERVLDHEDAGTGVEDARPLGGQLVVRLVSGLLLVGGEDGADLGAVI